MVRGKTRSISRPSLNCDIQTKIHNRFDVEVIDTRTGKVRQSCHGHNVICNQLWTNWFMKSKWNDYIHYGSGDGTPTSSDTKLFNRVGYAQSSHHAVDSDSDECWASYTRKIQLSESTAVGATITEVGIAYGTSETSLCTHAMLRDMNGNTISIKKKDTDIINIYATVFVHWTTTSAFKIFGPWKDAYVDQGGLSAFAGYCSSPMISYGAHIKKGIREQSYGTTPTGYIGYSTSFDSTTKKGTITFSRLTISQENKSGIHHLVLYHKAYEFSGITTYYLRHRPWGSIEFPSTQVPAVTVLGEAVATGDGVTTEFATKFPYAKNATVRVDGAVVTDVTVNSNTFAKGYTIRDYFEDVWVSGAGGNANDGGYSKTGEFNILYNPNYKIGIQSFYNYHGVDCYASNDLVDWEEVFVNESSTGTKTVPSEFVHYKYWKFVANGKTSNRPADNLANAAPPSTYNSNNILFDEPPAAGSVITIDYTPQCIPKDENHVFDVSVTFSFGEYDDT